MEGGCKITAKQAISKRVGKMQIKEATFFIPPLSCNPFLALSIICSDFKPFTNLSYMYMYMSMGLPELCTPSVINENFTCMQQKLDS